MKQKSTFTPREWLKIDIASNFGLDKKTWHERIHWFDSNEAQLHSLIGQAEEPALFYAGIKAWEDVQEGKPIGYMVSLDATSSGLQILACLTGDIHAAAICNVVNTGDREDAYQNVYKEMLNRSGGKAVLDKDMVKQAVMTAFYGSTAQPKLAFGEGALLDIFYKTMEQMAPGAWELNKAFLALWDDEAYSNDWVLPDNFHVHIKIMDTIREHVHFLGKPYEVFYKENLPVSQGRSLAANVTHSIDGMIVREITARCGYAPGLKQAIFDTVTLGTGTNTEGANDKMVITLWNHYLRSGYLSVQILNYLEQGNAGHVDQDVILALVDSMPEKPFTVMSIHQWWM